MSFYTVTLVSRSNKLSLEGLEEGALGVPEVLCVLYVVQVKEYPVPYV